jgi:Zn-dependent peptidase ImmA (M78 family)
MNEIATTTLASRFRHDNKLSLEEPINFRSLLYSLNIITVFKPLSRGFSGMSQKTEECNFMLINNNHSLGKQNFTICHELYHIYYQDDFTSMICDTGNFNKKNKIEYRADCFAADLLLPEFGILELIPSNESRLNLISLQTLLKIEHYYFCSRSALLYRLKTMNLIDGEFYDKYSKNVKKGAFENGYSLDIYQPSNQEMKVIGTYGEKAKTLFDIEKISESHYVSLMQDIGIDLDENIENDVEE